MSFSKTESTCKRIRLGRGGGVESLFFFMNFEDKKVERKLFEVVTF